MKKNKKTLSEAKKCEKEDQTYEEGPKLNKKCQENEEKN